MLRRSIVVSILAVTSQGCWQSNPDYCATDADCRDSTRSGYSAAKPECHGEGHFCHEGCSSDSDCNDKTKTWYTPSQLKCHPTRRDCVSVLTDGGIGDLEGNLDLGKQCVQSWQCKSTYCAQGYCCESACGETCRSCALPNSQGRCELVPASQDPKGDCGSDKDCKGSCDGNGGCTYPSGTDCGDPSCANGMLDHGRCDGKGTCGRLNEGCKGFACTADNKGCRTTCTAPADGCMSPLQCAGGKCVGSLVLGEQCYDTSEACESKNCVDGVCCKETITQCPECQTCAAGKGLACGNEADGPVPTGKSWCTGSTSPACRMNSCKAGQCEYQSEGYDCTPSTCSVSGLTHTLSTNRCDKAHTCVAKSESCPGFTTCASSTACKSGCLTHVDCIDKSVCDRSKAHEKTGGLGECIDPGKVYVVKATDTLAGAVGQGLPYVRVPLKTYAESVTIPPGKTVSIIGDGAVTVSPGTTGNLPAFLVSGGTGTSLTLQGLSLTFAGNADDADGVRCSGTSTSNRAALSVFECTIDNNTGQGVDASSCDVTLHRNVIQGNDGGGASLVGGAFVVVNNVIGPDNGGGGASFGGVNIQPPASLPPTFVNNTIVANTALADATSGIQCGAGVNVVNSIIWKNNSGKTPQYTLCTFTSSDVAGPTGSGNISVDPSFDASYKPQATACFNSGDNAAVANISIDIANTARIKPTPGGTVDMGAYEIQ